MLCDAVFIENRFSTFFFFSLSFVFVFASVNNFYHKRYGIHPWMKISSTTKNLKIEFSLQTTWVKWDILFHLSNIFDSSILSLNAYLVSLPSGEVCLSVKFPQQCWKCPSVCFCISISFVRLFVCLLPKQWRSLSVCLFLSPLCLSVSKMSGPLYIKFKSMF